MTYSLETLKSKQPQVLVQRQAPWRRFADELALLGGLAMLAFWMLALITYSPQDAAWSTSGNGHTIANAGGRIGAVLADGSYYLFGFSVWWCVGAGWRVWLSVVARWLRGHEALVPELPSGPVELSQLMRSRWIFWPGLLLPTSPSTRRQTAKS